LATASSTAGTRSTPDFVEQAGKVMTTIAK